jgi:hypothetical protein
MDSIRRKTLLALLTLPAGCGIQSLSPVRSQSIPGPTGPVPMRPPALGQSWTYHKLNGFNSAIVATEREEVTALSPRIIVSRKTDAGVTLPDEQHQSWGQVLRESHWDFPQNYVDPVPLWPVPFMAGAKQDVRSDYRLDNFSFPFWLQVQATVQGWEKVSLPMGEFDTIHVERLINIKHQDISRSSTTRWDHLWLAPEIGRWVIREITGIYVTSGKRGGGREDNFRWELQAWT